MKNFINNIIRYVHGLRRPTKAVNINRMHQRGETISSFFIREATVADIPALAALHVKTWNETYPSVSKPPTVQLREHQWRQLFSDINRNWFCYIIQNAQGNFIGFAKGQPYQHSNLPQFSGELNKIYLLQQYQRLGLGKKLLCAVANRLRQQGINNMVLFGTPQNPSGYFHEAMGAHKLYNKKGCFDGGYGWDDLTPLTDQCKTASTPTP